MNMLKKVFVFAEKTSALAELSAGGRQLGEFVAAIVVGSKAEAEAAAQIVDQVFWLGELDSSVMLEELTPTIARLLQAEVPELLLIRATQRGKVIAGRLAAILHTSVMTDIMALSPEADGIKGVRRVFGGAAERSETALSGTTIATIGTGVFEAGKESGNRQGTVTLVETVQTEKKMKRIETRKRIGESVNLSAAKRVVAVGRGIEKQENIGPVQELAGLLEAELGCTRPVAEGEKWLARERYIGVSGVMLKPDLYLALGLSGQIQHMVGVNQARVTLAVNKDKNAPIFKLVDYGIVGDLQKVVPALIAKFKD